PIVSVVMSPFSVPVMQMGFDKYFDMMMGDRELFWTLMKHNEAFCVAWANAQLDAGATAITYYDPVSSPTITSRALYLETGFEIAKRVLPQINGATATHFASGRTLEIADEIIQTGTNVVGTSTIEDLSDLKRAFANKVSVLGNLNGIEMREWSPAQAEAIVKDAIRKGAPGGGFILSDNHGEIPWQVPDEVLHAISGAVKKWGRYPLDWLENE
ncbi:MAG: uroporphyrinogen decarboxylase family protein, partial [Spongiibacteraceae bacterium]